MSFLIDQGKIMYWGTASWSNIEIYEAYSIAKTMNLICPIGEIAEYHWYHREKVELHMAELYNRIGKD